MKINDSHLELVKQMIQDKDYDPILIKYENGDYQNILPIVLCEYAEGIEKISGVKFEEVVKKLDSLLGKIRIDKWDANRDSGEGQEVKYAREFVGDDLEPIYESVAGTKMKNSVNCHYIDSAGKYKCAVGLITDDVRNLEVARQTLFHELTHVMAKSIVNRDELGQGDVPFETFSRDGRSFKNSTKLNDAIHIFSGVSTRENLGNGKLQMHNHIDEGFVESIAQEIYRKVVGKEPPELNRYGMQREVADSMMKALGRREAITNYLTRSYALIGKLERQEFEMYKGRGETSDLLHFGSDLINNRMGPEKYFVQLCKHNGKDINAIMNSQVLKNYFALSGKNINQLESFLMQEFGVQTFNDEGRKMMGSLRDYGWSMAGFPRFKDICNKISKDKNIENPIEV